MSQEIKLSHKQYEEKINDGQLIMNLSTRLAFGLSNGYLDFVFRNSCSTYTVFIYNMTTFWSNLQWTAVTIERILIY